MNDDASRLIHNVLNLKSLAIVGLEKNTGKTETLNYIVEHLHARRTLGLTSIGVDGEERDLVYGTEKPPVFVHEGVLYTTTEVFYRRRTVLSELHHVSVRTTPTGRLVLARALEPGRVVLAGPTDTDWMRKIVDLMLKSCELVIVDGALSRFTQASPSIAQGVVLATGAAYSLSIREIVRHTKFVYSLLTLDQTPTEDVEDLKSMGGLDTVCLFDPSKGWKKLEIGSALQMIRSDEFSKLIVSATKVYVPSALTDNVLRALSGKEVIIPDFTKCLFSAEAFFRYKPRLSVLQATRVVGVTVNPTSPTGHVLNPDVLKNELRTVLRDVPVVDVRGDR